MKASITDIQFCSLHDGPGIRTMVFFAGCGMRCKWCQNPEAFSAKPKLQINDRLCIGCQECFNACPYCAVAIDPAGGVLYNRKICKDCMACAEKCYALARKPSAKEISLDDLLAEALSDRVFFNQSGGGVTLSGGEPLLQADFNREFLKELKNQGISTAVETAGCYPAKNLEKVLPYADLFLFDIKLMDPLKHAWWTGVDNAQILSNFERAAKSARVILRVPLIPGVNDGEEFDSILAFAAKTGHVNELHILPFHHMGDEKYTQLGYACSMAQVNAENEDNIGRCRQAAEKAGFSVSVGGRGF
ncbi:MAG: glycyl-radical enzyme activating protein [Eubacteriales bacterium]